MALGLYHDAECQRPVSDADPLYLNTLMQVNQ